MAESFRQSWLRTGFFNEIDGWHFRGRHGSVVPLAESVRSLFFSVSSSGGGLPGRLGLERVPGRSLFLALSLRSRYRTSVAGDLKVRSSSTLDNTPKASVG